MRQNVSLKRASRVRRAKAGALSLPRGPGDLARQIAVLAGFTLSYEFVAALTRGDRVTALGHARAIAGLERSLGLFHEPAVQGLALRAPAIVLDLANWTYVNSQFTVSYALLAWIYLRRNTAFPIVRNAIVAIDALGLVGYVAYPTAPPRLVHSLGLMDTVQRTGLDQSSGLISRLADPYAAMPSLHTAYALLLGGAATILVRHRALRVFWAAYPAFVVFAIIATGNHFLLDALAGAALASVAAGFGIGTATTLRYPRARSRSQIPSTATGRAQACEFLAAVLRK